MLNSDQIIKLLKATEIFHDIPEEVLANNVLHFTVERFDEGNLIIRKNEIADSLYIIMTGKVKVHDEDYEVAQMGPGDFFGEMSLFSSGPRSMSVSALEPVEVIIIDQKLFFTVINNQPTVIRNIITGLVQRLRAQNNLLIDELRSREEELKREVAEQTEKYREQKERAERSEKFKEQFLANMSHEIRTPMNAVMGMTNILLEKNPSPDQVSYLEIIRKSSENLLVILNDILDLSKIEAGKIEMESIDFSIRDEMELVYQTLRYKAEEKGLVFTFHPDDNIPDMVVGDPIRLNQILINLVGNAIKFTEKGSVTVEVKSEISIAKMEHQKSPLSLFTFHVSDTGIGMTADQLEWIFESFTQASGETSRKFGGTGLGLSISKRLVELQGGEISVKSEHRKGSTFSFTLNYPISSNEKIRKKESEVTGEMVAKLRGIKILLAEDNEYNRIVTTETLELKIPEIKIIAATNGEEVIDLLKQKKTDHALETTRNPSALQNNSSYFDLILMDVQMPLMDGYEATQKIRSEFTSPEKDIPILALTASVLRTDIEKCLDAGMNGYVAKPFRTKDLLLAIYNILSSEPGKSVKKNETPLPSDKDPEKTVNVTDLGFLKNFTEGNDVRMKKYVRMYLESLPKNLSIIDKSLKEEDYTTLQRTVHSLKPHLTYMGMKEARSLAEKIEKYCAEKKDFSALLQLITQFTVICRKSIVELTGVIEG